MVSTASVIGITSVTDIPLDKNTILTEQPDNETRSVVTTDTETKKPGESMIEQPISKDYLVPEEIASEALIMLRDMSQPTMQEGDNDDEDNEYALPVGAARLPDIVSEMNEECGIKTVVDYDAEIPEEMKLKRTIHTKDNKQDTEKDPEKDIESDETIIYDASEFENVTQTTQEREEADNIEGEKSPRGQLQTQTYGIMK